MAIYPVVFSGVQPTGSVHIGNYLGAIRGWVELQKISGVSIFSVVDLHAITVPYDREILQDDVLKTAAIYLACGVDPAHSVIFSQSSLPEHNQMAWILGSKVPLGWLDRMTQFKDKIYANNSNKMLGLYSYPVLMAADILLYNTTHVPVGDDQKQHIELTRDIAQTFNCQYNEKIFTLPEILVTGIGSRIMSLRDASKKMSKSATSDYSRIGLLDSHDLVKKKINKAKSDSIQGFHPSSLPERPEANNLIEVYSAISGVKKPDICSKYKSFAELKHDLIDAIIACTEPIRQNYARLIEDKQHVSEILKHGTKKARELSQLEAVKTKIGF